MNDMINQVIHGDCLQIMKDIPDGSVDLTVTSPPYDNLRAYDNCCDDFNETKWKAIIGELYRITAIGGVVVWVVGDQTFNGSETGTSFRQALFAKECGFNLHDTMIYQKCGCSKPDKNRYYNQFEYMFILSKGKPVTFNQICDIKNKTHGRRVNCTEREASGKIRISWGKKNNVFVKEFSARYNIWKISNADKTFQRMHPAVFPLALAKDHIISWSNEGDIVLDPFAGSGTTCVAAINTGRRFIGIEKNSEYCAIAQRRVDEALNAPRQLELAGVI